MDIIGEGEHHNRGKSCSILTAGPVGFDFDFGALDNTNNPVTHMYESLL